jgi:Fuc2NAc and GlcNAc transferase
MNAFANYLSIGAGVSSIILTGLVRLYATRRNMLDIPNARSSHTLPTPRGGGLGIVVTFAAALILLAWSRLLDVESAAVLLMGGGIVAVAGFLDDRHSLPASARICAHLAAGGIFLVFIGKAPESWLTEFGLGHQWLGALCLLLALTWSTNLFNFMDGIDGIAGSEAAFVTGAGAWINSQQGDPGVTAAMLCLSAASAGFLAWNWPPARIFMGDVGSGFLGLMIPMLDLTASARAPIPLQVWIILGGLFLADATVTLLRRAIRGDRWFEAHRLHAYQRLARRWKSHQRVTILFSAINLSWLLPWAWYAAETPVHANRSLVAALTPVLMFVLAVGAGKRERAD